MSVQFLTSPFVSFFSLFSAVAGGTVRHEHAAAFEIVRILLFIWHQISDLSFCIRHLLWGKENRRSFVFKSRVLN